MRGTSSESLNSVSCDCPASCVSSRGTVRHVRHTRDKGPLNHHQRHTNSVSSETQLCFSCWQRGFLDQQTDESAILGQMCHCHHMHWVTSSSLCKWLPQKVAIFIAIDSLAEGKDPNWHCLEGYEVGLLWPLRRIQAFLASLARKAGPMVSLSTSQLLTIPSRVPI